MSYQDYRLPESHLQTSLETLSNSSPFYRHLFSSQKTTFIFGKVINILVKDNYIVNFNVVLNCRRVCKVWNAEVDKMLKMENYKLSWNKNRIEFDSYNKMVTFLANSEHTHPTNERSPFIGSKVCLEVNEEYVFHGPNIIEIKQLKLDGITTYLLKIWKPHKKYFLNF